LLILGGGAAGAGIANLISEQINPEQSLLREALIAAAALAPGLALGANYRGVARQKLAQLDMSGATAEQIARANRVRAASTGQLAAIAGGAGLAAYGGIDLGVNAINAIAGAIQGGASEEEAMRVGMAVQAAETGG
jgi:hypothetical protein